MNERDGDLFFRQEIKPAASVQKIVPEGLECFDSEIGYPAGEHDSKQVAITKEYLA